MANKMTKKDYYAILTEIVSGTDREDKDALCGFIAHEVELLSKKSSNTKPTKTQKANEDIKSEIVKALTAVGRGVTVSELQASAPSMGAYSNQKLSALLNQLVDCGMVVKTADKKKSLFSVQ